ncbi:hypothetical protein ON010_g11589 [Phytophthora cinnamomi]|nr:hypothetical protein ON010_g11589 [Phytophthora cinnamomi]
MAKVPVEHHFPTNLAPEDPKTTYIMPVESTTRIAIHENSAFVGAKKATAQWLTTVDEFEPVQYNTLEDAVVAVKKDDAHFAVLPVDSTTRGTCYDTYDLLLKYNLAIVGECQRPTKTSDGRFWMVAKTSAEPSPKTRQCKTSIAFAFASGNAHGQLHRALGLFAFNLLPLLRLP